MKKILAILMSVCVILAYMPVIALADTIALQTENLTITNTTITYTGSEVDPDVRVFASNTDLASGTDFTVVYKKNDVVTSPVNVGTYKAVVTGIGTYSGTIEKEFTITPKVATSLAVAIPDQIVGVVPDFSGVQISDGSTTLVNGTDYDIAFTESTTTKIGTNNATITYKGNYSGTKTVTFKGKYLLSATDYEITSAQTTPRVVTYAKNNKNTVAFNITKKNASAPNLTASDYTITYSENENYTGDYITATIEGKNNFMGAIAGINTNILIDKKSIESSSVSISVETSTAQDTAPSVTIKDGTYTLIEGTDYDITLIANNKIRITGQNNYKDSTEKVFTVGKALSTVTLSGSSFTYTGADIRPAITVKDNEGNVVPTSGYRIDWPADCRNVGSKQLTVVGIGSYAGQIQKTYLITAKGITGMNISMSSYSYRYTGGTITPEVSVLDGSTRLVKDKDYTLTYTSCVQPGAASVKVSFKGNYIGERTLTYYIGKDAMSGLTVTLDKSSYDYTGNPIRPTVTVKNGTRTVSSANYIVSYKDNTNIGTGTVIITGTNDYFGVLEVKFTIAGKKISNCTVTLSPNTFAADGTQKKPTAIVKYNSITLKENTDYTITYGDNKTAGQGTVTITGKGGYEGTQTVYFTITGLEQKITTNYSKYTKYITSSAFKITPFANGDGTGFLFLSSDSSVAEVAIDGTVTIKGIGKAKITISTIGDKKYTPATKTITITVKPKKVSVKSLTSTKAGKMTVKFQKQPGGITGTQIRYSKKSDFATYSTYNSKGVNDTDVTKIGTKTLSVKSGKTYYVKVRNYKTLDDGTKLYGSWSKVKKLTVK